MKEVQTVEAKVKPLNLFALKSDILKKELSQPIRFEEEKEEEEVPLATVSPRSKRLSGIFEKLLSPRKEQSEVLPLVFAFAHSSSRSIPCPYLEP